MVKREPEFAACQGTGIDRLRKQGDGGIVIPLGLRTYTLSQRLFRILARGRLCRGRCDVRTKRHHYSQRHEQSSSYRRQHDAVPPGAFAAQTVPPQSTHMVMDRHKPPHPVSLKLSDAPARRKPPGPS